MGNVTTVFAWLLEAQVAGCPVWLAEHPKCGRLWTPDASLARRFASFTEADRYEVPGSDYPWTPTEHGFDEVVE